MTAQLKDFGIGVDDYGVDKPLDHDSAAATVTTAARSSTGDAERPRLAGPARYGLIFLIGCIVLGLVGTSLLTLFRPAPDSAVESVSTESEPAEQEPAPLAAPLPPVDPTPAGSDVTAVTWQGYSMPVSASAGPQRMTDTRATGFARTPLGAALAALHISVRMAPMTGPKVYRPTITEQVVGHDTSKQLAAVTTQYQQLAKVAGVSGGAPVIGATPPFTGYRVRDYSDTSATVDLVVTNPYKNTDLQYAIPVRWVDGDWRIVFHPAATAGGWFTVTTPNPATNYEPFTKGPTS